MFTVWKFSVDQEHLNDVVTFDMPRGARPLSVGVQEESLCLWASVDPNQPAVPHRFRVAGTGHRLTSDERFVGTVHMLDGRLVLHVFDLGEA